MLGRFVFAIFVSSCVVLANAAFADSMCAYTKNGGLAQEETYVGFAQTEPAAAQLAFEKCATHWSAATCNSYRFAVSCNTFGAGCAYIKSEGTAQEVNYAGFGSTEVTALRRALDACVEKHSEGNCQTYFSTRCAQN